MRYDARVRPPSLISMIVIPIILFVEIIFGSILSITYHIPSGLQASLLAAWMSFGASMLWWQAALRPNDTVSNAYAAAFSGAAACFAAGSVTFPPDWSRIENVWTTIIFFWGVLLSLMPGSYFGDDFDFIRELFGSRSRQASLRRQAHKRIADRQSSSRRRLPTRR